MGASLGLSSFDQDSTTTVKLHVYDLGDSAAVGIVNGMLRNVGSGAFHVGVEVQGWEWSFYSLQGVGCCPPRKCGAHRFRETIVLGSTQMTPTEIGRLLVELRNAWPPSAYNTLRRNCCHFCDCLCRSLGVGPVPDWVMHLAKLADFLGMGDAVVKQSLASAGSRSAGGGGADGGGPSPHLHA